MGIHFEKINRKCHCSKPKRKRRKPSGGGNFRNVAMGALIGTGVTLAVDRAAKAVDAGVAKAAERIARRKQEDSWEDAARKVQ